ncbi:LCP family glycopolymer transferase [Corynebacterium sp. S7]
MASSPHAKPQSQRWLSGLTLVLVVLCLISWAIALFTSFRILAIPTNYLVIFWVIYSVILALLLWAAWKLSRAAKIVWRILAIVLVVALSSFHTYIGTVSAESRQAIRSFESPAQTSVEFLVVANSSTPDSAALLKNAGRTVGALSGDLNEFTIETDIKEADSELENSTFVPHDNLSELVAALQNNSIELATMRRTAFDALQTSLPELEGAFAIIGSYSAEAKNSDTENQASRSNATLEPTTIYISGIDSAGDIDTTGRSDVNILATVNPQTHKILLVNTPRDYYVQLDGTTGTKDKLTHAGIYGVDTARRTMENLYGIDIPYHVRVNFTTFLEIIDIIGPIEVYLPNDVGRFEAGLHNFNSEEALEFSRVRYGLDGGDRQRGSNQLIVLESILWKMSISRDPAMLQRVTDHISGSLETNISSELIGNFIQDQALSRQSWEFERFSVNGSDATETTYSMPGHQLYVMVPDETTVDEARRLINNVLTNNDDRST